MNLNTIQKKVFLLYLICILNNFSIIHKKLSNIKFRRWWIKPYLHPTLRLKYGSFNHTFRFFALHDQEEFYAFMHMTVREFSLLLEFTRKKLLKTSFRPALSPDIRLASVLHFLAHGGCIHNDSWAFRIGKSTMYALVKEVCSVLSDELIKRYVKFPTKQKWLQIADGFNTLWNFPNCIGALDGKHFHIEKPPKAGATFKNYKKYNSLVMMATCDHNKRITWFNFGDFGSYSDSSIFLTTDLYAKLEANEADIPSPKNLPNSNLQTPFVFVSDEIFGLKKYLMKPYARNNRLSHEEKIYNYRLSRARWTIECTFGMMSEKWEILQRPLRFDLKNCDQLISAIVGLHNFLLHENDTEEDITIDENYLSFEEINNALYPTIVRNRYKDYFSSPQGSVPWQEKCI